MILQGQMKQVQHLSGKLDKPSGGKSDYYTATVNLFVNKLIKTTSTVTKIVCEENEESEETE